MQPTRGLDVGAIEYVHKRLLEQRTAGMAILLISTELEEVLALSDRVLVLRNGRIAGALARSEASMEAVGELMLGAGRPETDGNRGMNSAALTVGGTDRVREIATAFGLTLLVAALCAVLLAVTGVNPLRAYFEIVRGAFGSPNAIAECLVYATPITLTALSVILCFRCGLWNIGADGQLYFGAIAASARRVSIHNSTVIAVILDT